jgi:Uma2 family endonuclease
MSSSASQVGGRYALPPLPVHRFTVAAYHRMIEAGILDEDVPVELLEGWVVPKMPRSPLHDAVIARLHNKVLGPRLPVGWYCRSQSAVTTSDSEPEPDLSVVRGAEFEYVARHPGPADLGLVIEVSDTTLRKDRGVKGRVYARAGIPFSWMVNLPDRRLEVYSDPSGSGATARYRRRQTFGVNKSIPLILDSARVTEIPMAEILP